MNLITLNLNIIKFDNFLKKVNFSSDGKYNLYFFLKDVAIVIKP